MAEQPRIDDATRFRRDPQVIASEIDGETVMMGVATGTYFGLKGVGGRIWELLEHEPSFAELANALLEQYAVEPEVCRAQARAFLLRLLDEGVVHVAGSAADPR